MPKYGFNAWIALIGPAGLPKPVVDGSYAAIYAKWLPGETPTRTKPEPSLGP